MNRQSDPGRRSRLTKANPAVTILKKIDFALMAAVAITLLAAVIIYFTDQTFFWKHFAAEDGVIEYGTVIFLFAAGLVLARNAVSLWSQGRPGAALLTAFYALLFVLAAGE